MDSTVLANTLMENFWKWCLEDRPEFASLCGIHDYDDKLENFSLEAIKQRVSACQNFLSDATNILSDPYLKIEVKENLLNLVSQLKTYIDGCNVKGYCFPICYFDGPQVELKRIIDAMPLNSAKDFYNILSRYKELPIQVSQCIDIMKYGISQKVTFHKISVAAVPEQIKLLEEIPEESVFYKPFLSIPDIVTIEEKEKILHEAKKSIAENILPSFKLLKEFFEEEYFGHTRPEIGLSSLPEGKAFYQQCLDYHLSCLMTPEQVHEMGLKEVDRISCEMTKVINSLNLKMSVKDFSEKLRKDESFYFKEPEELLNAYKHLVFEKIHPLLKKVVKTIPKSKLVIKPCDPSMSGGPAALYLAGDMEGKNPGVFYVNCTDCHKSAPKYEMVTLALHEALPGHHLQLSHLLEDENLPMYRRFIEDRKYASAPSRFPMYMVYMEGWGLYCEDLGYELGLYENPYDNFGHLSMEMLRATRLVVDTGIHAFGWSFDKAVEYMLEHTACSKTNIEKEVKRYVTLPGQACAYKVGELKLKSLRARAEKELGSKFNVAEFHDMILRNCGPIDILEQKTTEFIKVNA